MAKRERDPHPWQTLEAEAYHAFREWPIWLVLRERELAARTGQTEVQPASKGAQEKGEHTR